jgi:putative ABC transport system permease protein
LIVGALRSKGQSPFEDQDDRVLIPIGTWRSRVVPTLGDRVQMVMASAKSSERSAEAERQVRQILMQRHHIAEGDEPDFRIGTQEQFRQMQEGIFTVLTVLLLSVAAISLIVGGVGVMNIMLVGVTERTREIGIRMAIGARPRDIQVQFLLESIALTLFGGLAGIALAGVLIWGFAKDLGFPMELDPQAVLVAMTTSVAIGLVFGFWPARRAAHLDPIEALHHE